MNQKPLTAAIAGIGVLAFLAFMARDLIRPSHTGYSIKNDTSSVVAVSGCGETPKVAQLAQPAEQLIVTVPKQTLEPKCVLGDEAGIYIGCLSLPTTDAKSLEVAVSGARKDVPIGDCFSR